MSPWQAWIFAPGMRVSNSNMDMCGDETDLQILSPLFVFPSILLNRLGKLENI
jgi:hypothetical protein